ncbi:hypothetical protein H311_00755 [Anncaliia algerae PRA109]|nr:hypothetical protein H311_00755 [Anncaliia algerae PRA109]
MNNRAIKMLASSLLVLLLVVYISNYIFNMTYLLKIGQNVDETIQSSIPFNVLNKLSSNELQLLKKSFEVLPHAIYMYITQLLTEILIYVILNSLFFFEKTRSFIIKEMVKISNLLRIRVIDHEIIALKFVYHFTLVFSIQRLMNFNFNQYNIALAIIYSVGPFLLSNMFIVRNPFKLNIKHVLVVLTLYEMFKIIIEMEMVRNEILSFKQVPQFLTGKGLIEAEKFFGDEIYYIPNTNFSCSNFLYFYNINLIFTGDWSNFKEEEILAIVSHSIGRGNSVIRILFLILKLISINISALCYLHMVKIISKRIRLQNISDDTMKCFLLLINLPIAIMLKNLMEFCSMQLSVIFADIRAVYICKEGNLSAALIKYCLKTGDFVFRPFFYSLLNMSHPSTMLRIKIIEKLKGFV